MIKYVGNGEFLVTEDHLKELLEAEVIKNIGNYLGVDNWEGWSMERVALDDLYLDRGSDPYAVADSLVADIIKDAYK